jgi:hypothetical protein
MSANYLRTLYLPVSFVVLERKNGISMAKYRRCERKRSCPTVAGETEENREDSSKDRRHEAGIG